MVNWVQPTSTTNRIVTTILLVVAQIFTSIRLSVRIRTGRFWLDDAWIVVAAICSILLLVDMWIRTDLSASKVVRINAYWMVSLNFTNTLWSSRMSIIFSIIRLVPPHMKLRLISNASAILFALMWAALLIQKVYICASDKSWYHLPKPQCHLGTGVAAMELTTDAVADLALALIPIYLLRDVTLPRKQRKMLIAIFSSSLLISLSSIVHAIFLLGPTGLLEAISAQAEAAVALMVASSAVVVTVAYRFFRRDSDFDDKPYTYKVQVTTRGGILVQRFTRASDAQPESHTAIEFANMTASAETSSSSETTKRSSLKIDKSIDLYSHPESSVQDYEESQ